MRANTIIAGVNKSGTTSLFVSLSGHRDVAAASVKETRYFLPARWGHPLEPPTVYESYFSDAGDRKIRLEATPSYFYGGAAVADAVHAVCGDDVRILVVLREPVSRFWSFFNYQKARLRIPAGMTGEAYLEHADSLSDADFADPANEAWFAFGGGCYADWLPAWHERFGARLELVWFEQLMSDPARVLGEVAAFLGIDPSGYTSLDLASENRTTAYRRAGLQRIALRANDRFERFLRRHYALKERMRAIYYRVNGSRRRDRLPHALRATLEARYVEPNERLHRQLAATGRAGPVWLVDQEAGTQAAWKP
ncbi:MAG TPA: sulfotransferase domain-containing protein [Acidimicrobiia bacterium]